MKYFIALLVTAVFLSSCTAPKEETTVSLAYEMKTVYAESSGGCRSPLFPCASFEVVYPEFYQIKPEVKAILDQRINRIVAYDDPEADGLSIDQMASAFVNDFDGFVNEFPDYKISWYFKSQVEILRNTKELLSLIGRTEHYTGGAHGNRTVYFVNINPETGAEVTLSTLLKPGYEATLNAEAEKAFRKARELDSKESLAEAGFEFAEGRFELNSNYGFSADGIIFFFNAYEIAPYALGPTEFMVPWSALKDFLK